MTTNSTPIPVRRSYPWKVLLILLALTFLGAVLKTPAVLHVLGLADEPAAWPPVVTASILQEFILFGLIPAALGLALARRTGLGLPLVEAWLDRKPVRAPFRRAVGTALLAAAILAAIGIAILFAFRPLVLADFAAQGISETQFEATPQAPLWAMALASFSAGVLEETAFRLGLVTLFAWLGGLLWKDAEGRPRPAVLWTAIILVALLFGAAHFSNLTILGLPLTFSVIVYALLSNGIAAVAFGWLYWKRGLETAILAHFLVDILIHVLFPLGVQLAGG